MTQDEIRQIHWNNDYKKEKNEQDSIVINETFGKISWHSAFFNSTYRFSWVWEMIIVQSYFSIAPFCFATQNAVPGDLPRREMSLSSV